MIKAENAISHIKVRKEVVFLPYKASIWDSLESVYLAARDDEDCDAYVVPIPYYDKAKQLAERLGYSEYEIQRVMDARLFLDRQEQISDILEVPIRRLYEALTDEHYCFY